MTFRPLLAVMFLLAACAAAPQERQYLLEAPAPTNAAPVAPAGLTALGLREIAFPLYARRPQIASQDSDGAIIASDTYRWAEEPPRAATRLLARLLAAETGVQTYVEPWAQGASPNAIASVEVDRFIGSLGGQVTLEGQVIISHPGRSADRASSRFSLTQQVSGETHADLVRAYGAAIAQLSGVIRNAL